MLKKLYKYDWKSVSQVLLLLHGIFLIYSLLGRIGISIQMAQSAQELPLLTDNLFGMTGVFYLMIYGFFIMSILLTTMVYITVRTQKSLFSDEGYLTHTLPVTPAKLLWSKLFLYWTWMLIDLLCIALSLLLLTAFRETIPTLHRSFTTAFRGLSGLNWTLTLLRMLAQLLGYFPTLLLFALCLSGMFKNHKTLGAVLSFFGINMFMNLLDTIIAFTASNFRQAETVSMSTASFVLMPNTTLTVSLLESLVCSVFFFLGSRYILSKKLNLE